MLPKSLLYVALLTALVAGADTLQVAPVEPSAIVKRLAAGVTPHENREATVRELFGQAGCQAITQSVNKKTSNVICTLPGETSSVVVVGAHFDYVRKGQGIVDDWSGVSLLPSLYEALRGSPRKHTFAFVAFAAEEEGLLGSRRYVKQLTKEQRGEVRAFVNLECLGMTPMKVWLTRSTPSLVSLLNQVAASVGSLPRGVSLDNVGDDDTHSFQDARIPVISLHSVTQQNFGILHSDMDNMNAVVPDELYASYRTLVFYLAYLDAKLP